MNVHERYEYFMSVLMYKIMNNQTGNDLREMFQYASDIHTYNTRGADSGKLHIPRYPVECFKKKACIMLELKYGTILIKILKCPVVFRVLKTFINTSS